MIVFISDPGLIPHIQYQFNRPIMVFNFTSLYSGYPSLSALSTNMYNMNSSGLPTNIYVDTVGFDIDYANAIFNNDSMFEAFMNIMINAYQGINVIILVQRDNYRDALMESLIKLIQQRYGYICWIVEDVNDILTIHEPTFNPYGIIAMDQDIANYENLYRMGRVSTKIIQDISIE